MQVAQPTRQFWFYAFHLFVAFLLCLAFVGCSGDNSGKDSKSDEPAKEADAEKTTAVIPSKPGADASPSAAVAQLPPADAEPEVVCERFMKLLQSGQRLTAEKLLTRAALNVTSQAQWQIPPVGGLEARFEIGAVRYATNKRKLAQTDFRIVEQVDGKNEETEITWMVRRKAQGWRIFGMLVQLYDGQPKDLISFENPTDVAMIKETLADQQVQTDPESAVGTEDTSDTAEQISFYFGINR